MKTLSAFILLTAILAGCARPQDRFYGKPRDPSTTGYSDDKGTPYTNGGDARVPKAVEEDDQKDPEGKNLPKPAEGKKLLRERLIAFSMVRMDINSKKAKRFGKADYKISVFLRRDDRGYTELKFAGSFKGSSSELIVGPVSPEGDPNYVLVGKLYDHTDKVKGDFTITNTKTGEVGQVMYRAYRAKINVRTDSSPESAKANEKFAESILKLKTDTFGWVNNWVTVKGPSFYSVDILRFVHSDNVPEMPLLSVSGEALQTGEESDPDHKAQVAKNDSGIAEVKMVGDSGDEGNRLFEVTLEDETSKDQTQIMVEMEEENPEPKPVEEMPDYTGDEPVEVIVEPEPNPTPTTAPGEEPNIPEGLRGVTRNSFLSIDVSNPGIDKMVRDYEKNWDFVQVQAWIKSYTKPNSGWRGQMSNFFYYASPFRPLIESISATYNSPASFTYLTMMESGYFKGAVKNKHAEYFPGEKAGTSSATGIFQILTGTATGLGLRVDGNVDERKFFASSACGSALYIKQITDGLKGKDSTLAILGYFQGPGNMSKFIAQQKRLAANYNYTYREMARYKAVINEAMRNYVNQFLATYFIAGDPAQYGFTRAGLSELPKNGSIMPPGGIKSAKCRQAVR